MLGLLPEELGMQPRDLRARMLERVSCLGEPQRDAAELRLEIAHLLAERVDL